MKNPTLNDAGENGIIPLFHGGFVHFHGGRPEPLPREGREAGGNGRDGGRYLLLIEKIILIFLTNF